MSQTHQVLDMLRRGPVTPIDALQVGCFRLAARINELREMGYEIHTTIERKGEKRYARYTLLKKTAA